MAKLNAQAWGLRGSGVSYAAASTGGDVGINRPGLALAFRNVHATLARTLNLRASEACPEAGVLHDVAETVLSIPVTGASGQPALVPLGWDGSRFSLFSLEYTAGHYSDLRVALVELGRLRGVGTGQVAEVVSGSPGVVVRVGQGLADELVFTDAEVDGMLCPNGDGQTAIIADATFGGDVALKVLAQNPCRDGFFDHYATTVPAGQSRQLPRFPTHIYGTTLQVTYDVADGLRFAAIHLEVKGV